MKYRLIAKKILTAILRLEAELVLAKYQPKIIGVGGSVGKTSTKDALATILAATGHFVRASEKSYNSEFGIPLTILGCQSAWRNPIGWLRNILEGVALIFFENPYPEWLVLEIGADRPGDIAAIVKWLKLDVAVLTHFPDVPVHVEFFPSAKALHEEDLRLLAGLKPDGVVILNADDETLVGMTSRSKGKIISYGFNDQALIRASNEKIFYDDGPAGRKPAGITFKVDANGGSFPVRLEGFLGRHQIYPTLAALAFGLTQNFNMVNLIEAFRLHEGPPGRLKLVAGIKGSLILDDTYNSSPAALQAALETLAALESSTGRKIAVIGDMLELGPHTIEAHKAAGRQAAEICDIIATVGLRAKFVAEGAREKKFETKKLYHYHDAMAAGEGIERLLKSGDIVLFKASQSIRLEKAVEEIMAEPEKKTALLCRQDREWQER